MWPQTSLNCLANSPTFTANAVTMPSVFRCAQPPSPPPPAPATINLAYNVSGSSYVSCATVTSAVTNTLAQAGYTLPAPLTCNAQGTVVTLYGSYSASLVSQVAAYCTSAAGANAVVQAVGLPCGSSYTVLPSTTGVTTTVTCSYGASALCCAGKRRLLQ